MTLFVILLVGAFSLGVKFTADLVRTRPRKCSISHHLGVPMDATPSSASDEMAGQRHEPNPVTRIRTLYWSVR